jgi:hypothetical protein
MGTAMAQTPEDRTFHESSLCSLGPRPQIMTGLFVTLMRNHFADADNIEHAIFRSKLFVAGATTGVLIDDATVWTPDRTQKRPAIIVRRNKWMHLKRLTGFSTGTTEDGFSEHVKLWRGSHTLFCMAPEGAEAEILAAESYRFLMHFGPIFRKYFKLLMFELLEVGALSQVAEVNNLYVVPITIGYGWDEKWHIRTHAPPLGDIRLSGIFTTYLGTDDL